MAVRFLKHRSTVGAVVAAVIVTLNGCRDSRLPLEPTVAPPGGPVAPPTTPGFPPVTGRAVIYPRITPSFIPGSSRFVLYEDSTFALQYQRLDRSGFEYGGRYSHASRAITFDFNDSNRAGPWQATGTVREDSLIVKYNDVMSLADFEDGVYVRTPAIPGELFRDLRQKVPSSKRPPSSPGELLQDLHRALASRQALPAVP